jgi:hypothetical protein
VIRGAAATADEYGIARHTVSEYAISVATPNEQEDSGRPFRSFFEANP